MSAPASRRADTTWPPSAIDRGHARLPVCRNKSLFSQNDECTGAIKKTLSGLLKQQLKIIKYSSYQGWSTHTRTCTRTYSSTFLQYLAVLCT